MIGMSVTADIDILDAIEDRVNNTPKLMKTAMNRRIRASKTRVLKKLRAVPPRLPTLPFIWSRNPVKQARARRYYFAVVVGKGKRGGRYVRTGKLPRAWRTEGSTDLYAALYTVENRAPGAEYVYAERQVPSHTQTDWVYAPIVIAEERRRMEDDLIETWFTVTDPLAGVPR